MLTSCTSKAGRCYCWASPAEDMHCSGHIISFLFQFFCVGNIQLGMSNFVIAGWKGGCDRIDRGMIGGRGDTWCYLSGSYYDASVFPYY